MILMYHKIYLESPSIWWVDIDSFYRQMVELQSKKVVYLDEYDPTNPDHVVITFDGVYENVYKYALPILKKFNYPFELFITSKYIGKDNSFDTVDKRTGQPVNEPLAPFCNKQQLKELVKGGGRMQWHTVSHPNLTQSTQKELSSEITVPKTISALDKNGFKWIAYPHGEFNEEVLTHVKTKFEGGLSVIQGNDSDKYCFNRITVTNDSKFSKKTVGVIIPSYNYGSYLVEAIESVLKQTYLPHEILIIDDHSKDNTPEIGAYYAQQYPNLIRYVRNEKNLGVIRCFNKAVNLMTTEYVAFLGADNRFFTNYIEKTLSVILKNENCAVAYTDFVLFGPLASSMYQKVQKDRRAGQIDEQFYLVTFPESTDEQKKKIQKENYIHGSSLFSKDAFEQVGGYSKSKNRAEDHNLFYGMISNGYDAIKAHDTLLEYRQHSESQENTKLISIAELDFYKKKSRKLEDEINAIKSLKFWKAYILYKYPKVTIKKQIKKLLSKFIGNYLNT